MRVYYLCQLAAYFERGLDGAFLKEAGCLKSDLEVYICLECFFPPGSSAPFRKWSEKAFLVIVFHRRQNMKWISRTCISIEQSFFIPFSKMHAMAVPKETLISQKKEMEKEAHLLQFNAWKNDIACFPLFFVPFF